jgi:hypothetical protein
MTTIRPASTPSPRRPLRAVLLVVGSAVLVGLAVGAFLTAGATFGGSRVNASAWTSISASFAAVQITAGAADVSVRYADVGTARVDFHQSAEIRTATFSARVIDGVLVVRESVGGTLPLGWGAADSTTLDILLPRSDDAKPLPIDATVQAGNLELNGRFGAVNIVSNAGDIILRGGSSRLKIESAAGNVTASHYALNGSVTSTAKAGDSNFDFSTLPSRTTLDASAGNIRLTVPKGHYRIRDKTLAGNVRDDVASTPGASRIFTLESAAGDVTITNR